MFAYIRRLFTRSKPLSIADKQEAMAEIYDWLLPRVNEYYAPFIAEHQLGEKLKEAGISMAEFKTYVQNRQ